MPLDHHVTGRSSLRPGNAAAAIIVFDDDRLPVYELSILSLSSRAERQEFNGANDKISADITS